MMKKLFYIIIFLLFSTSVFAADIYIDPNWGGTESGTFAEPYNSWADFTITTGNDYRQKCGTSYTGNLSITNSGTSGNYIIIGAYYDSGGVVHEDDSPSYGANCGNATAKPTIIKSDNSGSVIFIDGEYIELNSIDIQKGDYSVNAKADYGKVLYCRLRFADYGIRGGLNSEDADSWEVKYNYIYTDRGEGEGAGDSWEGIELNWPSDSWVIENNVIDGFGHTCIIISRSQSHTVRYNHCLSHDGKCGHVVAIESNGATDNIVTHNKGTDAGDIQLLGGACNNTIAYNVLDGIGSDTGVATFINLQTTASTSGYNVTGNKIYNNLFYRNSGDTASVAGMREYAQAGTGVIEDNLFANNIIIDLDSGRYPVWILDDVVNKVESDPNDANVNWWRNNLAFNYGNANFARIQDSQVGTQYYTDASTFNGYGAADSNREDDPSLEGEATDKFWPSSNSSPLVGNGYTVSGGIDDLLTSATVWGSSTVVPNIITSPQPSGWYIGPYINIKLVDVSPVDGGTEISIAASATWDYAGDIDDVDVYLDKCTCISGNEKTTLVSNDDADKTHDMSTLDIDSDYCLVLVSNYGASQGDDQKYDFHTSEGPPVPPPQENYLTKVNINPGGCEIIIDPGGCEIVVGQ